MHHLLYRAFYSTLLVTCLSMNPSRASDSEQPVQQQVKDISPRVINAVHNPRRLSADVSRDVLRKPEKVLQFSDVKPGMRVLDFFSGGGYYAELLSYIVGEQGEVIAYNNKAYVNFANKQIQQHFANQRLPNVRQLTEEVNQLHLTPNSLDSIFMILAYHDIYFVDGNWPEIDSLRLRQQLFKALKPGGSLIIVDHHAPPLSPRSVANKLHRIDPELVKEELTEVGFNLVKYANFLYNAADDMEKPMFDPAIRGKTNRFVFMFRKP